MALRFFSVGDIHHRMDRLQRAVDFINQAGTQNKCDFSLILGDYNISTVNLSEMTDVKNALNSLSTRYFVTEGNHDGGDAYWGSACYSDVDCIGTGINCIFRQVFGVNPDQLYTVTKDTIDYQILMTGECDTSWSFDFNRTDLSLTKPTIVTSHGPLIDPINVTCPSAWTPDYIRYAVISNLKGQTDNLNMLAAYSGHVHAWNSTIINNRLYVVEDSISYTSCTGSDARPRNIGYTKITPNFNPPNPPTFTVQYQSMQYINNTDTAALTFVDPFPDIGCTNPTCRFNLI